MMVRARPEGSIVAVRVVPRASRSTLAGVRNGELLVRLSAPPVDGQANEALVDLLAETLGIPARTVSIVHGEHTRHKQVLILGMQPSEVTARLESAR